MKVLAVGSGPFKSVRVWIDEIEVTHRCFEAEDGPDGYVRCYVRDEASPHQFIFDGRIPRTVTLRGDVKITVQPKYVSSGRFA